MHVSVVLLVSYGLVRYGLVPLFGISYSSWQVCKALRVHFRGLRAQAFFRSLSTCELNNFELLG